MPNSRCTDRCMQRAPNSPSVPARTRHSTISSPRISTFCTGLSASCADGAPVLHIVLLVHAGHTEGARIAGDGGFAPPVGHVAIHQLPGPDFHLFHALWLPLADGEERRGL